MMEDGLGVRVVDSIEKKIIFLNQMLYTCAPTPFQHACLDVSALRMTDTKRVELQKKADGAVQILSWVMDVQPPEGGIFLFFPIPSSTDSDEFFKASLELGVGIMPGSIFGDYTNFARLSFVGDADELFEGCEKLARLTVQY